MAKRKEILITELYAETVRDVASSPEKWRSFLKSASRNYRLPFDEQLLVHVQSTGIGEMEQAVWTLGEERKYRDRRIG